MRRSILLVAVALACLVLVLPASAIVGGAPDFSHPYVGMLDNGSEGCSGTLISPRAVVTAAHCFANAPSRYGADHGQPRIRVSFDQQGLSNPNRLFYLGTFYWDSAFCMPCGNGKNKFDDHDVAVVILDAGIAMPSYGKLPRRDLAEDLRKNTAVDLVGFGVQAFVAPGQPDLDQVWTRFSANALVLKNEAGTDKNFLKVTPGQCLGDSGGPVFLAGTNVMLAEMSYGDVSLCDRPAFDYRLDGDALGWIAATVAAHS